jgi:hypothetical protein
MVDASLKPYPQALVKAAEESTRRLSRVDDRSGAGGRSPALAVNG